MSTILNPPFWIFEIWLPIWTTNILQFLSAILDPPFWILEIWFLIRHRLSKKPQIPSVGISLHFLTLSAILNFRSLTSDLKSNIHESLTSEDSFKSTHILQFLSAILDRPFWILKIGVLIRNYRSVKPAHTCTHIRTHELSLRFIISIRRIGSAILHFEKLIYYS